MPREAKCQHEKPDGEPCGFEGDVYEDGKCIWHSDTKAAKKKRTGMQAKGGRATAKKRRKRKIRTVAVSEVPTEDTPSTLEEVILWQGWIAVAVATDRLDARTAKEASGAIDKLRQAINDKEELDSRIKKVEKALEKLDEDGAASLKVV